MVLKSLGVTNGSRSGFLQIFISTSRVSYILTVQYVWLKVRAIFACCARLNHIFYYSAQFLLLTISLQYIFIFYFCARNISY